MSYNGLSRREYHALRREVDRDAREVLPHRVPLLWRAEWDAAGQVLRLWTRVPCGIQVEQFMTREGSRFTNTGRDIEVEQFCELIRGRLIDPASDPLALRVLAGETFEQLTPEGGLFDGRA